MDIAEGTLQDTINRRAEKKKFFNNTQITNMIITLVRALVLIKKEK